MNIQNNGHLFMFVPKPLKIEERPELENFPLNVMFGSEVKDDGRTFISYIKYEPDLSTYVRGKKNEEMRYRNPLDARFWLKITRELRSGAYTGTKYRDDESIGMAFGTHWDGFFAHFTALGVHLGDSER